MKILYISPENTVGTLSTWKRFHESKHHHCDFVTFYKTSNNFDSGICLDLPLISTSYLYRKIRALYYYNKYGQNGEYSVKPGKPPVWQITKWYEKQFFQWRDKKWKKIISSKLQDLDLLGYDIYHFEWGLDFYRDCSFVKQVSKLNKPIICTYHGQDLRTRGILKSLDSRSSINFSSELDLLSMHPKIEYMFLPYYIPNQPTFKKTKKTIKICHSPTNRHYKGSKLIIKICEKIAAQNQNVEFILIEKMPNSEVLKLKKTCDIIIDQIGDSGGWGYGMNSVESMALGLCCMTEMNPQCVSFFTGHPFVNINKNNFEKKIIELINNPNLIDDHKQNSINWAMNKHDVNKVGSFLYQKYDAILNEK